MQSRHLAPRAMGGVTLTVAVLVLAACGDDQPVDDAAVEEATSSTAAGDVSTTPTSSTTAGPEVTTISVSFADGAVVGGASTRTVPLDERVRIEVTGDTEDEVHVHTFDAVAEVTPASPAVIELTADIPGVHEVELEGSGLLLFELRVEP